MFMNVDQIRGKAPEWELPSLGDACLNMKDFPSIPLEDRWIFSRFNLAAKEVGEALLEYRFDHAANRIYDFFWGDLCDWYIELIKPRLNFEQSGNIAAAKAACLNLVTLFEASLRLLHPFMPFITEDIWHAMYLGNPPDKSIALTAYPQFSELGHDGRAATDMLILQDLIVSVRNLRAELKVETKARVPIQVFAHEPEMRTMIEQNRGAVERLANVETISFVDGSLAKLPGARHTARFDVHVVYERKIDVTAECDRLKKELERLNRSLASGQKQLSNEQFLAKAPANVVENLRQQQQELSGLREKTLSKMTELSCS
jgi:valyl-tRNA synthetase